MASASRQQAAGKQQQRSHSASQQSAHLRGPTGWQALCVSKTETGRSVSHTHTHTHISSYFTCQQAGLTCPLRAVAVAAAVAVSAAIAAAVAGSVKAETRFILLLLHVACTLHCYTLERGRGNGRGSGNCLLISAHLCHRFFVLHTFRCLPHRPACWILRSACDRIIIRQLLIPYNTMAGRALSISTIRTMVSIGREENKHHPTPPPHIMPLFTARILISFRTAFAALCGLK